MPTPSLTPKVLKLIRKQPMTVKQMAVVLDCNEQTLYEKMNQLEKEGLAHRSSMSAEGRTSIWKYGAEPINPYLPATILKFLGERSTAISTINIVRQIGCSHRAATMALDKLHKETKVQKFTTGWKVTKTETQRETEFMRNNRVKADIQLPPPGHKATPWDGLLLRL